jgi:hypothetical protein
MDKSRFVVVSILVLVYFLLEYTWISVEDVQIFYKVPFVYDSGPIRLDALVYAASVKVGHFILPLILYILTPFKKESKLMMIAFALAFVELFFTWNEPIHKVPLPFNWWIPISTTLLKLASCCYFMWGCVKDYFDE